MARNQRVAGRKYKFFCPVSLQIPWEWNLIYKECPLGPSERDMEECRTCVLHGLINIQKSQTKKTDRKEEQK